MSVKVSSKFQMGERDQAWLERLLKTIWAEHFHDVEPKAPIQIKFGKRARTRLGSITRENGIAVIRVTRLFEDPDVPEMVVKATVVHELCHYAHGFHSGLTQQHKHPHAGGIIRQEFAERGLEDLYIAQKKWLKDEWPGYVRKQYPHLTFRTKGARRRPRFRLI